MALKYSNLSGADLILPDNLLFDVSANLAFSIRVEPVVIIAVICNHCPFVLHIKSKMTECLNAYAGQGHAVYAISGNDPQQYPEDAPDKMRAFAENFKFKYLFDESQEFLRALQAECTPEFYIFKAGNLFYHGRFDGAAPSNSEQVTGIDLAVAVADLSKYDIARQQVVSQGCSIKWR